MMVMSGFFDPITGVSSSMSMLAVMMMINAPVFLVISEGSRRQSQEGHSNSRQDLQLKNLCNVHSDRELHEKLTT